MLVLVLWGKGFGLGKFTDLVDISTISGASSTSPVTLYTISRTVAFLYPGFAEVSLPLPTPRPGGYYKIP